MTIPWHSLHFFLFAIYQETDIESADNQSDTLHSRVTWVYLFSLSADACKSYRERLGSRQSHWLGSRPVWQTEVDIHHIHTNIYICIYTILSTHQRRAHFVTHWIEINTLPIYFNADDSDDDDCGGDDDDDCDNDGNDEDDDGIDDNDDQELLKSNYVADIFLKSHTSIWCGPKNFPSNTTKLYHIVNMSTMSDIYKHYEQWLCVYICRAQVRFGKYLAVVSAFMDESNECMYV